MTGLETPDQIFWYQPTEEFSKQINIAKSLVTMDLTAFVYERKLRLLPSSVTYFRYTLLCLALENKLIPQNENYFTSKSLFFFKMFLTLPYRMLNFPQTSPQTRLQDKTNSLTKYLEVIITFLFQQFFFPNNAVTLSRYVEYSMCLL